MQRSISYQNALSILFWVTLFAIYSAMSSIYLFFPPLLAFIGYRYQLALKANDLLMVAVFCLMLLIIEAEKGFWFGSSIIFFTMITLLLIPKLEQNMRCILCIKAIFVVASYLLFWLILTLINSILLLPQPSIDWHLFFYMGIEFALIAIFG